MIYLAIIFAAILNCFCCERICHGEQNCGMEYCIGVYSLSAQNFSMQGCTKEPTFNGFSCEFEKCKGYPSNNPDVLICCCNSTRCNDEIDIQGYTVPNTATVTVFNDDHAAFPLYKCVFVILPSIFLICLFIVLAFVISKRRCLIQKDKNHVYMPDIIKPEERRNLELIERKACGRYGVVWKATLGDESVAVKIFPSSDRESWLKEQEIYGLPYMTKHDNIVKFIATDTHKSVDGDIQYLLLTEYHSLGSLYDYLKMNTLSVSEVFHIAQTMVAGVSFLHEDVGPMDLCKPCIAHGDFKSKNVLLKNDLTACIADFGLAQSFHPGSNPRDTQAQVGTRRYMAPEVLEGAITFSRDSFLKIDMYAVALVIWELLTRCFVDAPVEPYKLPFEEEVGLQPSLQEMTQAVVNQRLRPRLQNYWLKHEKLNRLCVTIQECWDDDSDARLPSGCVLERLRTLSGKSNNFEMYKDSLA